MAQLRFERDFGSIKAGETLTFRVGGGPNARAFLPVEVTDGQVVARDAHGRPAIVLRPRGTGAMVLSTYPSNTSPPRAAGSTPSRPGACMPRWPTLPGWSRR